MNDTKRSRQPMMARHDNRLTFYKREEDVKKRGANDEEMMNI
jgi:hypothetical protein